MLMGMPIVMGSGHLPAHKERFSTKNDGRQTVRDAGATGDAMMMKVLVTLVMTSIRTIR